MMLTKEECENALDNILCNIGVARSDYRTSGKAKKDYHTLKVLIEEHFSNPPLKFEKIEEGKWYWHNKKKEWIKILNKDVCTSISPVIETIHEYINFERNCLYRKEVQE